MAEEKKYIHDDVYAEFFGSEKYPVEWKNEEEKKLMWFYDDLHCPNPISPMYFSVGGWWGPTCKYFYHRFGVGGSDWIAKRIGCYVYTAVVPETTPAELMPGMGAYYGGVITEYALNFMDQWDNEYVPELKELANKMVDFDFEGSSLGSAMIHLEDCLDWQERAFRIHWILNYAQAQASGTFGAIYEQATGAVDEDLSLINVSNDDRNWDSLRDAYNIKEYIKRVPAQYDLWTNKSKEEIMAEYADVEGGIELKKMMDAYIEEYGWKPLYAHEYIGKLWREDPTPVFAAIKGYVIDDYDYPTQIKRNNDSQQGAINRARAKITDPALKEEFEKWLEINLKMLTLTPNHHFYIDQAIYAHMRMAFLGVAGKLVKLGKLDDPEDIFYLFYDELRAGAFSDLDLKALVAAHKAEMAEAATKQPRYWYGTVDEWQLNVELYKRILWGYPEIFWATKDKYEAEEAGTVVESSSQVLEAIPGSAGVVEGPARVVSSPAEFDDIQPGEIMVCRMTNPGWIIAFSKIAGLVTDTGGALSHPAVVSREFGIPCVVGTITATSDIKTGDKIRVDGDNGTVTIL